MSISIHVHGFHPPDEKWHKMKAAYDSCLAAGTHPPKEVLEFFGWEEPEEAGVKIELEDHEAVSRYTEEMCDGFEVDLSKLPSNITRIRIYYSC